MENQHSRSASPREAPRPQHRPPSPPTPPEGFDNRAYQHDEDHNHNDSFSSHVPQHHNNSKEPIAETKALEAVNLELINLSPKNGKKKDVDVEMNAANPYDEYFVPVNEHRKYMRGEKLYVTADKRGEKGGCKRPLCWTLLALVVAAIIALIVLTATGVLFASSPTPLDQYNTTISSARALGGLGVGGTHDHGTTEHDHNAHDHSAHDHSTHGHNAHDHSVHDDSGHDHEDSNLEHTNNHDHNQVDQKHLGHDHSEHDHSTSASPELTSERSINDAMNPSSDESTDLSMYVPRTLEGELKVDNEEFSQAFQDPESEEYLQFANNFVFALKNAIFNRNEVENGKNEVMVEVVQLRPGSVVVKYRIHWKPKIVDENTQGAWLTAETLKEKLNTYLNSNSRMISIYHIADDKITASRVLDLCQINKNDCEHGCVFDEVALDFTCTCPRGMFLNMDNPKICMSLFDNYNDSQAKDTSKEKEFRVLDLDLAGTTRKSIPVEEPNIESVHVIQSGNTFDWKDSTGHEIHQTTTESDTDYKFSHVFGRPVDPKAEQEPTAEPAPESKAELEPESKAEPEPKTELEPEPKAEPEPEPNAEPEREPEPKAEPEPSQKAESVSGQKAESDSKPEPELTLQPEPAPVAEPEPTSEPEPTAEPKLESESSSENESKQVSDSETKHSLETTDTPEPTIEPKVHPEPAPVVETNSETKQTSETTEKPTYSVFQHYSEVINKSHHWDYLQNMGDQQNSKEFETTHLPVTETEVPPISYIPVTEEQPDANVTILQDYSGENNNMEVILPKRTSVNHSNITEFDNDWLDPISITNDELKFLNDEKNTTDTNTQFTDDMLENTNMGENHETQARSFKKQEMEYQVTTETPDDNKDDFRGDTKITEQGTIEESNSHPSISLFSYQDKLDKNTRPKIEEIMVEDETDKPTETEIQIDTENRTESKTLNNEIEKSKAIVPKNEFSSESEKSDMMTIIDVARLLQPHKEINTIASTTRDPEFSSGMEKQLMNITDSPIQKEKDLVDENVDITFDAINMLYNRSTKSTENNTQVISITEMTTETTDSDWLTEAVTEIDYEEMKGNIKPTMTSETAQKPEDVIMRGALPKYDFEPDYLNNFEPSRTSEQDEPHYGMIHDYDNADSRVKRVNNDLKESRNSRSEEQLNKFSASKPSINEKHVTTLTSTDSSSEEEGKLTTNRAVEMTTFPSTTKIVDPINDKLFNNEKESTVNVNTEPTKTTELVTEVNEFDRILKFVGEKNHNEAIETTTVGQFIYNSAERDLDVSTANKNSKNNNPAPVWEDISDNTKSILFKPSTVRLEQDSSEDSMSKNVTTTTAVTPLTVIITNGNISSNETDNASLTFQKNNLNVTIYEVPGHNSSIATSGHSHSAEYDDHETEMNPFLPEVENNKHLVKKLQEGHDLESLNANETQNENAEEQQFRSLYTQSVDEGAMNVSKDKNMTNNDGKKTTNVNSNENAAEIQVHKFQEHNNIATQERHNTAENKVSSFLSDTDDLDKPLPSTSAPSVSASITDDTEYLSVVPIKNLDGKATLKKKNKSDSIEELNDISDSRKKSDRRTLDAKKLGSVTNNEA